MPGSQSAQVHGSGNIVVQAIGDHISVNVHGAPHLTLIRPAARAIAAPVASEADLLRPFHRSIPFTGRDGDFSTLWDWLHSPPPISVRAVTGRAGAGKTRIAVELIARLEALPNGGWHAGFVTDDEMRRFSAQQNLSAWAWRLPTLVVVDYAAALVEPIWKWLCELAVNPGFDGRPLRLLLLEREAEPEHGWYRLLGDDSDSGAGTRRLFHPLEPLRLQPLAPAAPSLPKRSAPPRLRPALPSRPCPPKAAIPISTPFWRTPSGKTRSTP